NLWNKTFFDGYGRTYQTRGKGPSTADIVGDTTFDERGNLSTGSVPYYAGATPQNTTHNYDSLNRATKVTRPDGQTETTSYSIASVSTDPDLWPESNVKATTIDFGGHQVDRYVNAVGQLTSIREYKGGVANRTQYAFDVRGNPTRVSTDCGTSQTC